MPQEESQITRPPADLVLPAPAKLNLLLRILGRRSDGYHQLQTLFQLLDFGDELAFTRTKDNDITLSSDGGDAGNIPLEDNLIFRAGLLLREHCGASNGVHIHLHKRLPLGGGIGGGSSDAATTLLGLNHLWGCGLSIDTLADLGQQLGADVPVFVRGHTAWAEGVGEELVPVHTETRHYVVVIPGCSVSTAAVFRHPRLTRDSAAITLPHLRDRRLDGHWLERHSGNDCQPLVEELYPEVRAAREWLQQFASAQLTGTGACVFAAFEDAGKAQRVLGQLPAGWLGFAATGVNTSPVHEQLAKVTS
ncbi:4-(cytidine 5'-diphospho)-2-C-methyl-D-erythritol kinase [Microbulbifer sediminum]|uniref:4-(cytidine 5'-diphospho)-2-C-methyl-D-erythritol kinase n=1 Tax=Microbulbifer sediminum TaxID=2904250 RepID=UPI001F015FD3|nr:4-(cytidine 5'-diphospho)-2-C-methyl-D-erythritol kinase [Microbulbifer sediminum]